MRCRCGRGSFLLCATTASMTERKSLDRSCREPGITLRRDGSLSPDDTGKLIGACAQRMAANVALRRRLEEYEMAEWKQG